MTGRHRTAERVVCRYEVTLRSVRDGQKFIGEVVTSYDTIWNTAIETVRREYADRREDSFNLVNAVPL